MTHEMVVHGSYRVYDAYLSSACDVDVFVCTNTSKRVARIVAMMRLVHLAADIQQRTKDVSSI